MKRRLSVPVDHFNIREFAKMPIHRIVLAVVTVAVFTTPANGKDETPRVVMTVAIDGKSYTVRQRGKWAWASAQSVIVSGSPKYWKTLERAVEIATGCGSEGLTRRGGSLEVLLDCTVQPAPASPDEIAAPTPK